MTFKTVHKHSCGRETKQTAAIHIRPSENLCGGGVEYLHRNSASHKRRRNGTKEGRTIAQPVSRRLPTAAVRGSRPGLSCGILWWTKWR
jgi:hypothetical protein